MLWCPERGLRDTFAPRQVVPSVSASVSAAPPLVTRSPVASGCSLPPVLGAIRVGLVETAYPFVDVTGQPLAQTLLRLRDRSTITHLDARTMERTCLARWMLRRLSRGTSRR